MIYFEDCKVWKHLFPVFFDFYYTYTYSKICQEYDDGFAKLIHFKYDDYELFLPVLLKSIDDEYYDLTSVYGYSGPIQNKAFPHNVINVFQEELLDILLKNNIVSLFCRFHPLIENQIDSINGLGHVEKLGTTISIDLTMDSEKQFMEYRSNLRYDIRKLRAQKVICFKDERLEYIENFIDTYHSTMKDLNADEYYYFDNDYFSKLFNQPDFTAHLFVCMMDNEFIAGGIFIEFKDKLHYHLGGTVTNYKSLSPSKLFIDQARIWSNEKGLKLLHLGGGVGGREDHLHRFKRGFSKRRHDFFIWKWIVNHKKYEDLRGLFFKSLDSQKQNQVLESSFFPIYRLKC